MEELKILQKVSDTQGCEGCRMRQLFPDSTFVGPQITSSNRVMIGEAPGSDENATGKPFQGGAGRWLDFMCKKAGFKKDEVNIANVLCCQPPGNIFPTDSDARSYISKDDALKSVHQCLRNHVWPFLESRRWNRVDLLGGKALEHIAELKEGIYKWRGSPIAIPRLGPGLLAIPTIHPAAIARDQTMIPVVINDLRKSLTIPPENYSLHPSLDEVKSFTSTEFAFDIEVPKWFINPTDITMVGLCDRPYHAIVVPFQGPYISELKRIFRNARSVIGQNSLSYDIPVLGKRGVTISPECIHWDTMILQHLRFPSFPHDLEFIGTQFTSKPAWKSDKRDFELYCARDVDITMQSFKQLKPLIAHAQLEDLYHYTQVPLALICKQMEELGIKVDPKRIGEVREKITEEISKEEHLLPESLRSHKVTKNKRKPAPMGTLGKSGKPVKFITEPYEEVESPWASSVQIGEYLYKTLGLPEQHDVKTGKVTTGKMALDKLYNKTKDPSIKAIKNLRKKASMLNLFAKEEMLRVETVHTHYHLPGTCSGRLSSSDPNLQNVTEAARYLYIPRHEKWSLIDVDFSSIETRLTAYFAQDTDRLDKYAAIPNYSEHKYLASLITGIPYDEVEKDNDKDAPYGKAKRVVHGGNYGLGAKKMSLMYDMDFSDTKKIMERWKQEIKKTVKWQETTAAQAKKNGFLTTPFGRKNWFWTTSAYCVTPETRVLTSDLNWVPVGSLKVGDSLVGFDEENAAGKGAGRKYRKALVEATGRRRLPCYQIATDRGAVTASSDHGFLVKRKQSRGAAWKDVWVPARLLEPGDLIRYFGAPWVEDITKDGGWLSGLLDGEGTLGDYSVEFAQNEGAVLDRAKRLFKDRGYKITRVYRVENVSPRTNELTGKINEHVTVAEENYQRMKVLGELRPTRLLEQAEETWVGRRISSRRPKYAKVLEVNFRGTCEVVPLQTSTRTLITEGLFSHNTESLSFLPQSTAADIIFRCMIALMYERIGWPLEKVQKVVGYVEPLPKPANLLLQVHDSLVVECPDEMIPQVLGVLKRVLEQGWKELGGFSIPIGMTVGKSWGECTPYTGKII